MTTSTLFLQMIKYLYKMIKIALHNDRNVIRKILHTETVINILEHLVVGKVLIISTLRKTENGITEDILT